MAQKDIRTERMAHAPIPQTITAMALPAIAGMLIGAIYNMTDTFFVGQLGTSAVAAVGILFPFQALAGAAGLTFGIGGASYLSRLLGAGRQKKAEEVLAVSYVTAFIMGVLLEIVGLVWMAPILQLLGATDTMLPYAEAYFRYILLATPFNVMVMCCNHCLRSEGSSMLSMVASVVGAVLNMVLDPIFIFVFNLGVAGAAIATGISQFASFALFMWPYLRRKTVLRLSLKNFKPTAQIYGEVIKIGAPSAVREGLSSVSLVLLNNIAAGYGDAVLAAMSVSGKLTWMAFSVVIGFAQGFTPVAGFNYGARCLERVLKAFKFTAIVETVYLILACAALILFAPQLIALFQSDPEVIRLGSYGLRATALCMIPQAPVVVMNCQYQAMGKSIPATVISLARQGFCFIPLIFILPYCFGAEGALLCQGGADLLSLLVALPFAFMLAKMFRKLKQDWTMEGESVR